MISGDIQNPFFELFSVAGQAGDKRKNILGNFFSKANQRASVILIFGGVQKLKNRGITGDFPVIFHLFESIPDKGIKPVEDAEKIYKMIDETIQVTAMLQLMEEYAAHFACIEIRYQMNRYINLWTNETDSKGRF